MKRLVLHIYIMFMVLTAMACPSNEVKLVQDWDKTFPKSEKVNHEKVTFKTQYGFTLAADLYIPKNAEGKLPAIYGAQNEAYKCPLVENVANGLCFS
nr:MAG TPA: cutinase [Caudoviricetes sp.]